MRSERRTAAWVALACLQLACASSSDVDLHVSHDPLAVFPETATLLWDARANSLSGDERVAELGLDALIREAAGEAFAARGYRVSDSRRAQYLLSYQASLTTRNRPEGPIAVGSISLLLVEAASGRRAWVGFLRAQVDPTRTPEQRRESLRAAFGQLLAEFPPRGPSSG